MMKCSCTHVYVAFFGSSDKGLRRVTNIPIPYGDFKKHINVLNKMSENRPSITNDIKFILNLGCGLEVLESLGIRVVF